MAVLLFYIISLTTLLIGFIYLGVIFLHPEAQLKRKIEKDLKKTNLEKKAPKKEPDLCP